MKLTNQNIQDLYKFTRQHFVEHYDVQTELVDHLANDIEEILEEKPDFTFREARDLSFKKFGVFGFMGVVEEKQKQLSKKYAKILWRFTKDWFQLPKIILTISIFIVFYNALLFKNGYYLIIGLFVLSMFFAGYKLYHLRKKMKKKDKKWMLEEMLLTQGGGSAFFIATYPLHFSYRTFNGDYKTVLMSFFLTSLTIILYVSLEVIPKKSEELLTEHYPEYKIV